MKIKHFLSFFFCTLSLIPCWAELLSSPTWGFTVDLPEGFQLIEKDGNSAFIFQHTMMDVTTVLYGYPLTRYKNAEETMVGALNAIGAEGEAYPVIWRNTECFLGQFYMGERGNSDMGWAFSVTLPEQKGIFLLLTYCNEQYFEDYQQFLLSIVDSVCIDRGSFYEPGPVTSFAFPSEGEKEIVLQIEDQTIRTKMDISDIEANQFVIEREYAVLTLYQSSELWKEAWQRYYRMIYRDTYKRLLYASFDIQNALLNKLYEKPDIDIDYELSNTLLHWTQTFSYERNVGDSDFAPVPSMLVGGGSDCDSRSMLLTVLLSQMNYKTMLFVSATYSHAIFGIDIPGDGARIAFGGNNYLLGETTAKVDLGLIASDMADTKQWIPISGIQ